MNQIGPHAQISKYKARQAKIRISNYSSVISLLLALSAFGHGPTTAAVVSFLLILPLPLYFVLQSIKLTRKANQLKTHINLLKSNVDLLESTFSFGKFMSQPNLAFRLSLVLLVLAFFTTLARTRTQDITISYQPYAVSRTP